jgi:flagellar biosynthesis/type III secretory pathway chaperone
MIKENAQVADLLTITSRLIEVLEREIEMLRAMRPSEMQSLQHDKIVLAAAYEAAIRALEGDPMAAQAITPAVRAELRDVTERFHRVLAANERALRATKEATNRLLKHIVAEVEKQQRGPGTYGPASAVPTPASAIQRRAVSVTLDQRL